ncbi:MAG: pilin [Steroidobacteraceae bacterium]
MQKGFTLIELMIVVAIIGILAAIAIPAYQDYTIRAQVSEGSSLIGGVETAFDEYYANTGTAANITTNSTLGITSTISGTYVSSVTTLANQITVTYGSNSNANINGDTVIWTAYASPNGDITWLCDDGTSSTAAIASGTLTAVQGGTSPSPGTITNGSYLPHVCQ